MPVPVPDIEQKTVLNPMDLRVWGRETRKGAATMLCEMWYIEKYSAGDSNWAFGQGGPLDKETPKPWPAE